MDDKKQQRALEVFTEALVTGDISGAIMNQEKRGQQELVKSASLPCHVANHQSFEDLKPKLETMGIIFGKQIDDLFIEATLPPGWQLVGTDHSMWSKLTDDKGRERAAIFYKAAFYDRKAHISLTRRYGYACRPVNGWETYDWKDESAAWEGLVLDSEAIIWKSEPLIGNDYDNHRRLELQAHDWLSSHFPDFDNPLAYWDYSC